MNQTPEQVRGLPERLAKRIARSGVCSRREAEGLIEAGKVRVNGKIIRTPAFNVSDGDKVEVSGKPLAAKEETRLWLYHKPQGLVTTHKDPGGRPTVFQALPKTMPRVISVGRLDLNSEGLLLLTNDGALSRKLELPSTGWIRRYRVRVHGKVTDKMIDQLKAGVTVDGVQYGSVKIEFENPHPATLNPHPNPLPKREREARPRRAGEGAYNQWVIVSLSEGKNREIRKVFEHFGCMVNRLIRLSYGPFQLGSLPRGELKEVSAKVIGSFVASR
jgi:23S rRNA pseudouridine2605 synthase